MPFPSDTSIPTSYTVPGSLMSTLHTEIPPANLTSYQFSWDITKAFRDPSNMYRAFVDILGPELLHLDDHDHGLKLVIGFQDLAPIP